MGDPSHLIYFAGFAPSPFVFRTVESGAMLLLERGRATLVADNLLAPALGRSFADEVVAPVWYEGKRSAPHRRGMLVETALGRLAKVPGRRFGVELAGVPAGVVEGLRRARPGVEVVDIGPAVRPLRRAKDPDEIDILRLSMRAGEAGHAAALAKVEPGMTELDAYRIVQDAAIEALGEPAIVYGDFASGPRCERERGGPPTSRAIDRGDLLLLDFSVVVSGYRGDFTNTFAVGAEPTPRQRELFEACAGALRAGRGVAEARHPRPRGRRRRAGPLRRDGPRPLLRDPLRARPRPGPPRAPYFVPESDDTVLDGDVVALEPGLYVEGVGGMRFERNYRVTAGGPRPSRTTRSGSSRPGAG